MNIIAIGLVGLVITGLVVMLYMVGFALNLTVVGLGVI